MDVKIRRAELSDTEAMSVVVDAAWRENYKDIFSKEQIANYTGEHRRKSFTNLLNGGKDIFVLTIGEETAAVCAVQTCGEKPLKGYAEIMLMYVHPKFQHQGFGSRLLLYTLKEMRSKGYSHAVLDTAEKNAKARRFYEKHGFALQEQYENRTSYVTYMIEL